MPTRLVTSFVCRACCQCLLPRAPRRAFSAVFPLRADDSAPLGGPPRGDALDGLSELSASISSPRRHRASRNDNYKANAQRGTGFMRTFSEPGNLVTAEAARNLEIYPEVEAQPYRLHVYAHKHNTHITFVQPPQPISASASNRAGSGGESVRDVIFSISAGNIGQRKAHRGSYDAAYQLAAFALTQIKERGFLTKMKNLEVVLRGFGAGRDAVTKALLGSEGRFVRRSIKVVRDATRLKHGGSRSKKPRRLG